MSTAAILNGLHNSQQQLADVMKAEWRDLSTKRELADGDNGRFQRLDDREDVIRDANWLLTNSINVWKEAKEALLDTGDEKAARHLASEALSLYGQAQDRLDSNTPPLVPPPSLVKEPSSEAVATPPATPEPVREWGQQEGGSYGYSSDDFDENSMWASGPQEFPVDPLPSHAEGRDHQSEGLREELDRLARSSLTPEHAAVLGNFSPDELERILQNGSLSRTNTEDLRWLAILRGKLVEEGLSPIDLVYGARLGRKVRRVGEWSHEKRGYLPRRNN